MRTPTGVIERRRVADPVVLRMDDHSRIAGAASKDLNLRNDERRDGDVEHLSVPGRPGVGPAAVVADSNRRGRANGAERPHARGSYQRHLSNRFIQGDGLLVAHISAAICHRFV